MARYTDAVCRLCRRETLKLFLKGQRCLTEKCAIERRNFIPGQHGKSRRARIQGYGLQLREKQKLRRLYGVLEAQFRNYFKKAFASKGVTGDLLLSMLERRLDNTVYRLGMASSRPQARQLVRHGHILVNNKKVNIPSFQVNEGQVIMVRKRSRNLSLIQNALGLAASQGIPSWLALDQENFSGKVSGTPTKEDINFPIQVQMVVELYSK